MQLTNKKYIYKKLKKKKFFEKIKIKFLTWKKYKINKNKKHNFLNFINNKILMELYGKLVFNKLET